MNVLGHYNRLSFCSSLQYPQKISVERLRALMDEFGIDDVENGDAATSGADAVGTGRGNGDGTPEETQGMTTGEDGGRGDGGGGGGGRDEEEGATGVNSNDDQEGHRTDLNDTSSLIRRNVHADAKDAS